MIAIAHPPEHTTAQTAFDDALDSLNTLGIAHLVESIRRLGTKPIVTLHTAAEFVKAFAGKPIETHWTGRGELLLVVLTGGVEYHAFEPVGDPYDCSGSRFEKWEQLLPDRTEYWCSDRVTNKSEMWHGGWGQLGGWVVKQLGRVAQ